MVRRRVLSLRLKAQYIGYMAVGLLLDLIFYAVLYLCRINTFVTLALTLMLGGMMLMLVYHLNGRYGEHGLGKALAKRSIPRVVKSASRNVFKTRQS